MATHEVVPTPDKTREEIKCEVDAKSDAVVKLVQRYRDASLCHIFYMVQYLFI